MDDDLVQEFVAETAEGLAEADGLLLALERDPSDADALARIFRIVHTIKGTCGFFGFERLETLAHATESLLDPVRAGERALTPDATDLLLAALDRLRAIVADLRDSGQEGEGSDADLVARLLSGMPMADGGPEGPGAGEAAAAEHGDADGAGALAGPSGRSEAGPASVRVRVDVLDNLMATVSELVLTRNRLLQIAGERGTDADALVMPLAQLSQVTRALQGEVMRARMLAVGTVLQPFTRLVRDLGRELGKPLVLTLEGGDVELDRQVLERIKDPLTHLVRNAADHGIEAPDRRAASDKPASGQIAIAARAEGGHIAIEVSDDGAGLDFASIRDKAVARGLLDKAAARAADERQLSDLIFAPGFSTAAAVTSVSGRGVGMDVVRRNIEEIGGSVEAESVTGRGTRFRMKIPLTLAIVPALIVEAGGQRFALPQLSVRKLLRPAGTPGAHVDEVHGAPLLSVDGRTVPLLSLARRLALTESGRPFSTVILLEIGAGLYGLGVDRVLGSEDIVVKPLSRLLRHLPHVSGATLLGDGRAAMILDAVGLAEGLSCAPTAMEKRGTADAERRRQSFLILRIGPGPARALPLGAVRRIVTVAAAALSQGAWGEVADLGDALVPVVRLAGDAEGSSEPGSRPMVLLGGAVPVALAADAVLDIVETAEEPPAGDGLAPVAAVMRLGGEAVDVLDMTWIEARAAARRPALSRTGAVA
ncbi:chemotaxis protein CheA [Futiania mangrovi]|uniref:Chemotaxis protein CheA n=1 Tax=Futiania mangrovi TaxID=2959716 RepID=A0A9J6P9I6_9PROT|nr:chemotaxis protein CheA [Futiania mangrovii]MCP1334913.1 chemotaxis protein CheW [Futiania mangrovii]